MRLLWAGFMAILAAGVGFGIRGGIFDNWGSEFGFSGAELGAIGGAGFTGFCFGIIIGGFVADKLGYGKLVIAAFALHVLSAFVTFMPGAGMESALVYKYLFWGMFIFATANGVLEAVANPLVATLFPEKRTHYLNILHASWPAGLVLGGLCGWFLDDLFKWHWKYQLALYLIPTAIYGLMFFGQKFPKSEASQKGLGLGEMFKDVGVLGALVVAYLLVLFFNLNMGLDKTSSWIIGVLLVVVAGIMTRKQTEVPVQSWLMLMMCTLVAIFLQMGLNLPHLGTLILAGALLLGMGVTMKWAVGAFLLFILFITHAMVGAVELGTDGWIQNITGNILSSSEGKWLFIITSLTMFCLRFCASWIEDNLKLSPVGILLVSAIAACVGLNMASGIQTFAGAMVALLVYGIGKTFFWPTMLAVASDRYPRTGAIAISIMGGIGMLSAGLIGSPGLGYAKDRFSGEALQAADATVYESYQSGSPSSFLFFAEATGIDGAKFGEVKAKLSTARDILKEGKAPEKPKEADIKDKTEEEVKKANEKFESDTAIYEKLKEAGIITEGGSSNLEDGYKALTDAEVKVHKASIEGDKRTLKADSFIPGIMAVIYLLILLYFKSIGGYKPVTIEGEEVDVADSSDDDLSDESKDDEKKVDES